MKANKRIKVAVVGGGCASLTAAYELSRPEHKQKYDITVYQMGWRLGGKGASGRGEADRIEEHGLHLWMGFYENAFRLMRECYAERQKLHPQQRFSDWQDAFKPAPDVGVTDLSDEGWQFWLAHFPAGQGLPGDPGHRKNFSMTEYMESTIRLIVELLRSAMELHPENVPPEDQDKNTSPLFGVEMDFTPEGLISGVDRLFRYGRLASIAAAIEACEALRTATLQIAQLTPLPGGVLLPLRIIDGLAEMARDQMRTVVAQDTELQRIWHVLDIVLAALRGMYRDNLLTDPRGFDALNEHDWRDWLRSHGASDESLQCGFMRGIYDLAFAYEDGDISRPRLAAGVALRGALRMFFTYRGALFWRMSGGMGDVVFAPLYQVLKARGVRFEFFHRLKKIKLSKFKEDHGQPFIKELRMDVQAQVPGDQAYQPLIDVNGVPSWPATPLYEQLQNGQALASQQPDFEAVWEKTRSAKKHLQLGKDFDCVVLGVSIGALPEVAQELIERAPRWRAMVEHVKTVPTQALQVWMRKSVAELGWPTPGVNISGYVEPFDTWADMSHLLEEENFRTPVGSVAYFCSVLADTDRAMSVTEESQAQQYQQVLCNAATFLKRDAPTLWPNATDEHGHFDWQQLIDPAEGEESYLTGEHGAAKLERQFWSANVNPSDRYVLSVPGSPKYRLSPLDMTFDNLVVTGDWTATGLDSGCIESAVMSGLLAAHGVCGEPGLSKIVGYDHP